MNFSLALLQLLSVLSLFCCLNPISSQCLDNQKSSLLSLFSSIHNLSWMTNTDCCSWDGVTCDHSTGHVIGLDLANRSITVPINSTSLISLSSLRTLNLSFNSFNSTIPAALGSLSNLTHLNLSSAGFIGKVPVEITRIKSLVSLDLSDSGFPGLIYRPLLHLQSPNFEFLVGNLSELRELYLDGVDISSPLPKSMAGLAKLTSLHLSTCNLIGEFSGKIFHMQNLESLDLSRNPLLTGTFPEFPFDNRLRILSLGGTLLGGKTFSGELPNSIGNLRYLQRLQLENCNFSGPIPLSMGVLTQLVYLDLSENNFIGGIPSLENLTRLVHLDLSNNNLSGTIISFAKERLLNLRVLNLRNNSLNGKIPSCLFSLPSLQQLDLSYNHFDARLDEFDNASASLSRVDLGYNKLQGPIPRSLFQLTPSLQYLFLNDNQFDGQLDEFDIASVSLKTIDLAKNKLQGPIPRPFFQLTWLINLSLSSNNFSGTIDLSLFQNFTALRVLEFSNNDLTIGGIDHITSSFPQVMSLQLSSCGLDKFPNFLQDQKSLGILDLSNNKIGGEMPNWIWNIHYWFFPYLNLSHNNITGQPPPGLYSSRLSVIDLHSNKLQGPIPFPPPYALVVDYSHNNFTSVIPRNISVNLGYSIFFSLSSNKISGEIPPSICDARSLVLLDLSNNNLSGSIPHCLGRLEKLQVLNLGNNNFHGAVPQSFLQGCSLRTLNLNGNHLQGSLPESLQNCKYLEVLNIGNNWIYSSFPSWLGSLSQLQVLILRSNKFYGPILIPQGPNAFSQLRIIDLSSNGFSGSLSLECFQKMKAMMLDEDEKQAKLQPQILKFTIMAGVYYQESVTITQKGLELEFLKILNIFTSLDLSNNRFQGNIPMGIGNLTSLKGLNMSHNEFRGPIPSSFGNLRQLESLDLSANELSGEIPTNLIALTFLSVLNLSQNFLYGTVPQGNQFSTFSNDSFQDNLGLCGPPLSRRCEVVAPPNSRGGSSQSGNEFDWIFLLCIGLGFIVGNWMVMGSIIFWTKGRRCFCKYVDKMLAIAEEWLCRGL